MSTGASLVARTHRAERVACGNRKKRKKKERTKKKFFKTSILQHHKVKHSTKSLCSKQLCPNTLFLYQTNVNTMSSTARIVHDYSMSVTLLKKFPSVCLLWTPEGERSGVNLHVCSWTGKIQCTLFQKYYYRGQHTSASKAFFFPMGIHTLYIRENTT